MSFALQANGTGRSFCCDGRHMNRIKLTVERLRPMTSMSVSYLNEMTSAGKLFFHQPTTYAFQQIASLCPLDSTAVPEWLERISVHRSECTSKECESSPFTLNPQLRGMFLKILHLLFTLPGKVKIFEFSWSVFVWDYNSNH